MLTRRPRPAIAYSHSREPRVSAATNILAGPKIRLLSPVMVRFFVIFLFIHNSTILIIATGNVTAACDKTADNEPPLFLHLFLKYHCRP